MAHAATSDLEKAKRRKRLSTTTAILPAKKDVSSSSPSHVVNLSPLEQKINLVTKDIQPFYKKMLKEDVLAENANNICDYIISNKRENNVGTHII
jgi:hypothetical protein